MILYYMLFETIQRYGQLAQLVEQRTLNPWVQGSSPWLSTTKKQRIKSDALFFFALKHQKKQSSTDDAFFIDWYKY